MNEDAIKKKWEAEGFKNHLRQLMVYAFECENIYFVDKNFLKEVPEADRIYFIKHLPTIILKQPGYSSVTKFSPEAIVFMHFERRKREVSAFIIKNKFQPAKNPRIASII